jgi:hypothetical protein
MLTPPVVPCGLLLLAALAIEVRHPAPGAPLRAALPAAPPIRVGYEVQLAYVGYTGLATSLDCRVLVDLQGYDSLVGTVSGIETPNEPDEDVVYTGTLRRRTRLDYCEAKPAPTSDQLAWCVAKLTGAARMDVEVTVYGEAGRGAWIKAVPAKNPLDSVTVAGNCLQADMDSIRVDYPSGESAGSPDGQEIAETTPPRFVLNRIPRLRAGYFPPDSIQGGWDLRVGRATP